jgi:hypothetical protein
MVIDFLYANSDVFAWKPSDKSGILREVTKHALRIKPGSKPIQQRLHPFDKEKRRAIDEEIAKLLVAGFIKEVYHPEWFANHILVKNKSRKWRMRVDYTGLNNACPKGIYVLYHTQIR